VIFSDRRKGREKKGHTCIASEQNRAKCSTLQSKKERDRPTADGKAGAEKGWAFAKFPAPRRKGKKSVSHRLLAFVLPSWQGERGEKEIRREAGHVPRPLTWFLVKQPEAGERGQENVYFKFQFGVQEKRGGKKKGRYDRKVAQPKSVEGGYPFEGKKKEERSHASFACKDEKEGKKESLPLFLRKIEVQKSGEKKKKREKKKGKGGEPDLWSKCNARNWQGSGEGRKGGKGPGESSQEVSRMAQTSNGKGKEREKKRGSIPIVFAPIRLKDPGTAGKWLKLSSPAVLREERGGKKKRKREQARCSIVLCHLLPKKGGGGTKGYHLGQSNRFLGNGERGKGDRGKGVRHNLCPKWA